MPKKRGWELLIEPKTLDDGTIIVAQSTTIQSTIQARNLLKKIGITTHTPNGGRKVICHHPDLSQACEHEYQHITNNQIDGRIILGGHLLVGYTTNNKIVIMHILPPNNPPEATLRSSLAPGKNHPPSKADLQLAYAAYFQTRQSFNGGNPRKGRH